MANGTSTAATAGGSATSGKMSVDQYNTLARQQLVSNSILKKQIIYTFTGDPATINNTINIGGNFVYWRWLRFDIFTNKHSIIPNIKSKYNWNC